MIRSRIKIRSKTWKSAHFDLLKNMKWGEKAEESSRIAGLLERELSTACLDFASMSFHSPFVITFNCFKRSFLNPL